eukprot:TRINITY_DN57954_c0_g1_i1.p1 TRINITY_DN57954_c0_g1~~TRINITY_DN57954_c0_g1_i1.p1  ORF type:complete len:322 (+),score=41.43 TRINITY_DN57954_c0_g1_i1:27-968(+)
MKIMKAIKKIFKREEYDLLEGDAAVEGLPFLQQVCAGSCAGFSEHLGVFPIDTIKTHMQAKEANTGFFKTAIQLYRHQGIMRFYRGVIPILTGCIPAHTAFFGTYEFAKARIFQRDGTLHFLAGFGVGALASMIHDLFLTPMDVFKQRMQLSGCKRAIRYAKLIIKTEGLAALFRSLPVTIIMNLPFSSILVTVNENMKVYVKPEKRKNKFFYYFLCACFAGTVASLVTNPLDVIKTRLQTQNMEVGMIRDTSDEVLTDVKYKDILSSIKMLMREEKIVWMKRGIVPRSIQASISSALSWVSYEIIKNVLIGP